LVDTGAPVIARTNTDAAGEARLERLELELSERYVIKRASVKIGAVTIGQTEYRFRGDTAQVNEPRWVRFTSATPQESGSDFSRR